MPQPKPLISVNTCPQLLRAKVIVRVTGLTVIALQQIFPFESLQETVMWEDFSLALCRQGVKMIASWQWYVNRNCWVLLLKNPSKERGWLNWEVLLFFPLYPQKENAAAVVFIIEGMCWEWHNSKLEESRTLKQTDIKCRRKIVNIIDEGQTLKWKGFCISLWVKCISINPKLKNLRQENHEFEANPDYLGKICCNFF